MTNKIDTPEEERRNEEGNTESINTIKLEEGPKNKPQLDPKDPAATKKIGSSENDEEKEVEWIDAEEPLDLIDTSEESIYESLNKEMSRCSLYYDFRIRKGDPRNLKIPCRKAHFLEDKKIPSVGVFDEVFSTWMTFGGNTHDLAHLEKKRTRLRLYTKYLKEPRHTERGDGVASIKRHRRDLQSDGVKDFVTASERQAKHEGLNVKQNMQVYDEAKYAECLSEICKTTVQDDSSRSGNDTDADDADIRPIYDEEPMAEVQLTAECNIFAIGQQHTEQPEIIIEGQHGQILNETSNKAKIEKEIDVLETMNIELEHSVATLRKENETLKQHYKDLYDSIKITRSKTTEQTTSLLANNAKLKAQIQEKVFAIAALKNDLRKLKGNSVDTKFDKTSVLGKPVLPSLRNQSVVRQPNAFKSERAQMSKQRFASQVDVNKNLSKPVTQHYLPKKTESTFAKPYHKYNASTHLGIISKNMT
ncbi:hypothetical protein Tco_0940231 [Tanacetum coccineum]|uniref:Uncharacterized protein n=1 Tax=Tanacetum coccineum TaxID=301880 RepID=A0ABQ5DQ33_9ASTR